MLKTDLLEYIKFLSIRGELSTHSIADGLGFVGHRLAYIKEISCACNFMCYSNDSSKENNANTI